MADKPYSDPRVPRDAPDPLVEQDAERVSAEVFMKPPDGWTWRPGYATPAFGTVVSLPTSDGYSCQIDLATDNRPEAEVKAQVVEWLKKSLPYLAMHNDTYLGGWVSPTFNRMYLDVSERYDEHDGALKLGQERNQESVFRLSDATIHQTGGDGK